MSYGNRVETVAAGDAVVDGDDRWRMDGVRVDGDVVGSALEDLGVVECPMDGVEKFDGGGVAVVLVADCIEARR